MSTEKLLKRSTYMKILVSDLDGTIYEIKQYQSIDLKAINDFAK